MAKLNALFESLPISSFPLPPHGKVIVIDSTASIVEAAQILTKHNILCAPVRDVSAPADAPWTQKYLGVVDMTGIALAVLETVAAEGRKSDSFYELLMKKRAFAEKKVTDCLGAWEWGPFVPLQPTSSILDAMFLLSSKRRLHRIPIVDASGEIANIFTQSALLRFLAEHESAVSSIGKQTLKDLGLADPLPVYSVNIESNTVDAFRLIRDKHVSAVGVVGRDGMLVGVVSARDVRTVICTSQIFELMTSPLRTFLEHVNRSRVDVMNPAVRCHGHDTLESIVARMVASRIHRIFVVDEHARPIRVISLGDVFDQYVEEPQGYFGDFFVQGAPVGVGL